LNSFIQLLEEEKKLFLLLLLEMKNMKNMKNEIREKNE